MTYTTLVDYLRAHAARAPASLALLAPGRHPLTYAGLLAQIERTVAQLNACGVGRGDRVALVLPPGPEMATALVGTAAGAICAPLNPAFTGAEFEFYLGDLQARALMVMAGSDSPAVGVARALGVAVLELAPNLDEPSGTFALHGAPRPLCGLGGLAALDESALNYYTSGTTAQPKRVPFPQHRLARMGECLAQAAALTPGDRCFNTMPLFHGHGLVAALLASLWAGASLICPPGFLAPRFFEWLAEFRPTWYTGVPAIHQAVLARAAEQPARPAHTLRFIRSASAFMSIALRDELEHVFQVPVIEGYSMTETNLIAGTPLGRPRKPGSVGVAGGSDVAIMAVDGAQLLPAGEVGEIVVRGPLVMDGYENDDEANRQAFAHGWFHTGDLGRLDSDGYLFLTGRLKELISRGAERIAPWEVEAVLEAHPAVAEAVVFGVPNQRLGETVAAAVVMRPGAAVAAGVLRRLVAEQLAFYKVPERLEVVSALPRGPLGKVQRLGLAAQLGLAEVPPSLAAAAYAPPENEMEQLLVELWQVVLGRERVGRHDRFLDLGGDSLLATQLVGRVANALGLALTLLDLFDAPTVAQQAELLAGLLPVARQGGASGHDAEPLVYGRL